jgi:hypothetical protein
LYLGKSQPILIKNNNSETRYQKRQSQDFDSFNNYDDDDDDDIDYGEKIVERDDIFNIPNSDYDKDIIRDDDDVDVYSCQNSESYNSNNDFKIQQPQEQEQQRKQILLQKLEETVKPFNFKKTLTKTIKTKEEVEDISVSIFF